MNAVEGGTVLPVEVAGHGLIGEEHKLFDKLVGFVRGLPFNPARPATLVEQDTQFGEIQIQGAGGEAAFPQGGGKSPGLLEKTIEIVGRGAVEAQLGLRVGKAVTGVDDGAVETCGANPSIRADPDKGGIGESLFPRPEGAEVIRKAGRKHGNDAVDEVDTVGAPAGFLIQGGAGADVVGDIGDMDADLGVAPGELAQGNGVVEIAGGIGIDGDDEVAAQVLTVGGLVGKFDSREGRGLGDRLGRELGG